MERARLGARGRPEYASRKDRKEFRSAELRDFPEDSLLPVLYRF
jgi:hypothetical protein